MSFLDRLTSKDTERGESLTDDLARIVSSKKNRATIVEYMVQGRHYVVALNKFGRVAMVYDHKEPLDMEARMLWGTDSVHSDFIDDAAKISRGSDNNRFHIFAGHFSHSSLFVEYIESIYHDYTLQKLRDLAGIYESVSNANRRITAVNENDVRKMTFYDRDVAGVGEDISDVIRREEKAYRKILGKEKLPTDARRVVQSLVVSDAVGMDPREDTDKIVIAASEAGGHSLSSVRDQATGFLWVDILERVARANQHGWVKLSDPKTGVSVETFSARPQEIPSFPDVSSQPVGSSVSFDIDEEVSFAEEFEESSQHSEPNKDTDTNFAADIIARSSPNTQSSGDDARVEEPEENHDDADTVDDSNDDDESAETDPSQEHSSVPDDDDDPHSSETSEEGTDDTEESETTVDEDIEYLVEPDIAGPEEEAFAVDDDGKTSADDSPDISPEEDTLRRETDENGGWRDGDLPDEISIDEIRLEEEFIEKEERRRNNATERSQRKTLPVVDSADSSTLSTLNDESVPEDGLQSLKKTKNREAEVSDIFADLIADKHDAQEKLGMIPSQEKMYQDELDYLNDVLSLAESEVDDLEQEMEEAREARDRAEEHYEQVLSRVDERHSASLKARHHVSQVAILLEKLRTERTYYENTVTYAEEALEKARQSIPATVDSALAVLLQEGVKVSLPDDTGETPDDTDSAVLEDDTGSIGDDDGEESHREAHSDDEDVSEPSDGSAGESSEDDVDEETAERLRILEDEGGVVSPAGSL